MEILKTFSNVLTRVGVKPHDCHSSLPRNAEFNGVALGGGAISYQEGVAIAGLLYVIRPDIVIELGTARGASSILVGAALKDIGHGSLISVDLQPEPPEVANQIVTDFCLPVTYRTSINSIPFLQEFKVEFSKRYFIFCDTEIKTRILEVGIIYDKFPKGTLILVHDTSDLHPNGPMKLKSFYPDKDMVELPSPRGLMVMRT